ncbi:MAG: transketolase-like TK C-terminal-containing protein, partial [Psychrobacter sp.]
REVQKAAQILNDEFNITANVWSVTSFNELTRDGMACDDYNRLHPMEEEVVPWVTEQLAPHKGIVVAATDYMRNYSEQIRAWLPDNRPYITLGTDGYGRSDTREQLRSFFNVDAAHIVVATLKRLADEGEVEMRLVKDAISSFGIEVDQPPAWQQQPHYDHFPDAPAPDNVNPNPVPDFVGEDDDEISSEGRAEDQADAELLNDDDIKE